MWELAWKIGKFALLALLAGAVVVTVHGIITKRELEKALAQEGISEAIVNMMNHTDKVVKLKALKGDKEIEVKGDGISNDVRKGEVIYAVA